MTTITDLLWLHCSVCVGTTLLLLTAMWAGLSKWHWFVRATVIFASLAALYPIRAFEPMVWFAIAMPLTAWMSRYTWGRRRPSATEQESDAKGLRIQFSLVDFLLAILLASVAMAFGAALRREQATIHWEPGFSVVCSLLVGQLCLAVVLAKRWWRLLAGVSLVTAIVLLASVYAWAIQTLPHYDFILVIYYAEPKERFFFSSLFLGNLAVLMLLALQLARSLTPLPPTASDGRKRFMIVSRVTLVPLLCVSSFQI